MEKNKLCYRWASLIDPTTFSSWCPNTLHNASTKYGGNFTFTCKKYIIIRVSSLHNWSFKTSKWDVLGPFEGEGDSDWAMFFLCKFPHGSYSSLSKVVLLVQVKLLRSFFEWFNHLVVANSSTLFSSFSKILHIASREVWREVSFFRGREIDEQRYERRHRRGSDFFSISKKQKVMSFYSKKRARLTFRVQTVLQRFWY